MKQHQTTRTTRDPSTGEKTTHKLNITEAELGQAQRGELRSPHYADLSLTEIVECLMNAYSIELARWTLFTDLPREVATERAAVVWRAALPELTDKHSVLAYIACVSWGQRMNLINFQEAKAMMFMAQTQLSALKGVTPPQGSAPQTAGTGESIRKFSPDRDTKTARCETCDKALNDREVVTFGKFCCKECMENRPLRAN